MRVKVTGVEMTSCFEVLAARQTCDQVEVHFWKTNTWKLEVSSMLMTPATVVVKVVVAIGRIGGPGEINVRDLVTRPETSQPVRAETCSPRVIYSVNKIVSPQASPRLLRWQSQLASTVLCIECDENRFVCQYTSDTIRPVAFRYYLAGS